MDDSQFRHKIYRAFAETGRGPTPAMLAGWAGGLDRADQVLHRLHDAHALVLDDTGDIRMALPFSTFETGHAVASAERSWWANCAWDTLAVPAALRVDATIESTWMDTGEPVDLSVVGGDLSHTDGFIHFAVPARRWWDDIVET